MSTEPLFYWFIEDGAQEMCAVPFTEQEHDRALFWQDYLSRANPARGPYTVFRATHALNQYGKMIPSKREGI